MGFFNRATLSDAFGIAADSEGICLAHAVERAYQRALFSTGDDSVAEEHAIEVTSTLARKWQKENGQSSPDDGSMGYFVQPNRAYQIDITSFAKLNKYKQEWLSECWAGRRTLDQATMAYWFIEHIVDYGIKRHSSYIAIGVLKVLFNYKYEEIEEVLELINKRWSSSFRDKKDELRRWKKKLFKNLMDWFGRTLKEGKSDSPNDIFSEGRLAKQVVTDQTLKNVFNTLRFLTPLKPECALPQKPYSEFYDLESLLEKHALSSSAHAVERERIHLMNHPDDVFYILNILGDKPETNSQGEYLELPEFKLPEGNGKGSPPIDPQHLPRLGDQQRRRIERELLRRKKRTGNLAIKSVLIAVDDEERMELSLDLPQTVQLRLSDGNSLIEVRARDQKRTLPLDALFISWNRDLMGNEPQCYHVDLGGGRELNLLIDYERNSFGDLSGASLEIKYWHVLDPSTTAPFAEWIQKYNISTRFNKWRFGQVVIVLSLVLIAGSIYWYSRLPTQRPDANNIARQSSDESLHVPAALPSPSPSLVPNVSSNPHEIQSPARLKLKLNTTRRQVTSDLRDSIVLAQSNILKLDDYPDPNDLDRDVPGGRRVSRSSKPHFIIYPSRMRLTSVQIKLPEGSSKGQQVVDIQDGFFRSLVHGKIESFDGETLTVSFDLRDLPYKNYLLAITHGHDVPKHYPVSLNDSKAPLRRTQKRSAR